MADAPVGQVTVLLQRIAEGSAVAREQLAELVYADLRAMAARELAAVRGHTLQPTALANEAWLRLAGREAGLGNRQHFLGVAAKAMRSVLVDHVRRRRAIKRGGLAERCPLDESVAFLEAGEVDLLDLDAAMAELEADDPVLARQVELRFFGGMTNGEIAAVEHCSESTIERGWRVARARLRRRLSGWADA
ncbi:MAG: sigma-70 family RNA polymerase sigma factor [Planctomycetes bacterium]|nr:sigma-70 family RNA polymerase sigma factor [Planctomycetota bacterium]